MKTTDKETVLQARENLLKEKVKSTIRPVWLLLMSAFLVFAAAPVYAADTDGDGVEDINDLDDDNDGIYDTEEALKCALVPNPSFGAAQGPTALDSADLNNPQQGDKFLYIGVYAGVDAIVTVEEVSNANVEELDVTSQGEDAYFQPKVSYSSSDGYVQFAIQFVQTGTTTPIAPNTFFVTATDNDDGEIVGFDNAVLTNVYTDTPTNEGVVSLWSGYTTYRGDEHQDGIGSDPEFEISAVYTDTSLIRYRVSFNGTSTGRWHALIAAPCRMESNFVTPPVLGEELDSDHDGIPDYHDLDSDGDGIPDNVEAQNTSSYTAPSGSVDSDGVDTSYTGGLSPVNTDSTDVPDYIDTDSDNDSIDDRTEAGYTYSGNFTDTDGDGIIDTYDDVDGFDVNDDLDNGATTLPNIDTDPNDVDFRSLSDSDGDGILDSVDVDDDNDGILDVDEGYSSVYLNNPGFEEPVYRSDIFTVNHPVQANVPSWSTTNSSGTIEIWSHGNLATNDELHVPSDTGVQHAELNDNHVSSLYQDIETIPGSVITWSVAHRGRRGVDVATVSIGAPGTALTVVETMTDDTSGWGHYTGTYVVPDGQTVTRFSFDSISAAGDDETVGNFIDSFTLAWSSTDNDNDGIPNHLDIDADGDGIPDNIEAQSSTGYIAPIGNDSDGDGLDDAYDPDFDAANHPISAVDTDGDGDVDYLDLDSDNDGKSDALEGWDTDNDGVADTVPSGVDADGDGLDDAYDNDTTASIANNGTTAQSYPNDDGGTDERDWRENVAPVATDNA